MKLFLLCLGFYLIIFSDARAQDSSHTVIKDTLILADSSRMQDSGNAPNAKNNQVKVNDSLKFIQKGTVSVRGAETTVREDTIVDIFSEMRKASEQQDLSMKPQKGPAASSKNRISLSADSTENQQHPGTTAPSPDHPQKNPKGEDMKATTAPKPDSINTSLQDKAPSGVTAPTQLKTAVVDQAADQRRPPSSDSAATSEAKASQQTAIHPSMNPNNNLADTGDSSSPSDRLQNSRASSRKDSHSQNQSGETGIAIDTAAANGTDTLQKAKIESIFQIVGKEADQDSIASVHQQKTDADTTKLMAASVASNTDSIPGRDGQANSNGAGTVQNKEDKEGGDSSDGRGTKDIQKGLDSARSNLANTLRQNQVDSQKVGTPFEQLFKPYRKFDKNTSIESTTSLTIMQQDVNYKTMADFTTEYQRSGTQGNNFLFDVVVSKLNTEVETMGVQLKYDSNDQTDSTSTFAKPLFDIVGKRSYLKVDTTGKITEIDTSALARQVNTVLSGLSLSGSDFEVGSNFGLLLNRSNDSLVLGQSWQDATTQGTNKRLTTYKIQNILNDELIVVISGTVEQTGEIVSDGVAFKTQFTGTQQGKLHVDKQTGLIKSKELTLNLKGTVLYKDNALPASAVSKIKENVTYD